MPTGSAPSVPPPPGASRAASAPRPTEPVRGGLLAGLFDADATQIGVVLIVYNVAGLVASLVIPTLADRHADYLRPLVGCALLIGALAVALALSGSLLVALVVLGAPASVGGTLLPLNRLISAIVCARPALGPSLGVAPSGRWMWKS